MTTMQKIQEIEHEVRKKKEKGAEGRARTQRRTRRIGAARSSSLSPLLSAQMARTQKNQATAGHLGMLKVCVCVCV